ncbi:MAG: bifunctional diaminohydroxyphosphoribosylaminopyrimidine deaminase/5-amino-6-(5-phosphoribosylamino)uracil reductase RibD [Acidobacteria bacterium]|nr:bifunctional diaminohydroxyphosphoribosylaminopyrimidine deaminase/5-amino-6-(5-phosphoribosylamino)uracil reductase RibD [Acidobacteriota bacterium]
MSLRRGSPLDGLRVTDAAWMRRALFHAGRAIGNTSPNPMVGAVVVSSDGLVVGEGRHHRAGEPHAEVHALDEAGAAARGATLYVTLEPCCHTGRTGPCTRRILDAGVVRVVAAMPDPNRLVSGRGFEQLRAHGVSVDIGLGRQQAERLNRGFLSVQSRGRPFVMLKAATSLDGCIAAAVGRRTNLTSTEANRRTHLLRASVDAIGVGSGTILVDDPLLTVRECHRVSRLARVVFDRRLRTPPHARLLSTVDHGPVIILTGETAATAAPARVRALEEAGAEVVPTPGDLRASLTLLVARGILTLLVEGGGALHDAFWAMGLVDEVHLVVAPVVLGSAGVPLMGGRPFPRAALDLTLVEPRGPDTWIEADVYRAR